MKSFINKFSTHTSRFEFFLLAVPFVCWIICFYNFFTGHLPLYEDAISYADHICFYTDNLCKGVYPLWDPAWFSGAPNDFFLRRIGDVNPLLFLIVLLKWLGVPSAGAYLVFLGFYYFLAGWGFYLIARFLFAERFFAFIAYVLLLFSSWGSEIFYNYIIIIFVPIIWFFYFLLGFSRNPQKRYFLGMCFCVGLIVTTYIPFFFLTILTLFSFFYLLLYAKDLVPLLKRAFGFLSKNKIFTIFCIFFIAVSCIPGLMFYKESKGGEFSLPNRHLGANTSSAVAVGIENITSGDIISHGYFDRIFDDHSNLDMGDVYLPYVFFILLLITVCARVNKLIFFLLFNILGLSLITITTAAGLHRFLYDHIAIFKFIRNIYYFFWLGILPMGILLAVGAFKSLFNSINSSSKKTSWLVFILICHMIFILFLFTRQGVLWGAWVGVLISLSYFLFYFFSERKISYLAGFIAILLAVFAQSVQVYHCLDNKLFQYRPNKIVLKENRKIMKMDLYYASSWFTILVNYIDPQVLQTYINCHFIFYDNVVPYRDSPEFFKTLQASWAANINVAFIPNSQSASGDWKNNPAAMPQADTAAVVSGQLSVISTDANTMVLKTHLVNSRFLVINDNYNDAWHAFINGQPARLFRANFSFKGLWVPSGDSRIVLRYASPKVYLLHLGLITLFAGTFILLLLLFIKGRKTK